MKSFSLFAAISFAACAVAAMASADPATAPAAPGTASDQSSDHADAQKKRAAAVQDCVRQTGDPTASVREQCEALNVDTYDKSQIDSTGATNLGDALSRLDPRVSVSHR